MTADELLRHLTSAIFIIVFLGATATALRERTRPAFDAAVFFGVLGLVVVQGEIARILGLELPPLLQDVLLVAVIALPYLFIRLVDDLVGVPRPVQVFALAGLAVLSAVLIAAPSPLPGPLTLAAVAYFGALLIYGSALLVADARHAAGVARRRTQAAALGSALLGVVILLAGARLAVPVPEEIGRVVTLGAALAYAAAFTPPGSLRRAWREPGLRRFLARIAAVPPESSMVTVITELEAASADVMGAAAVEISLAPPGEAAPSVRHAGDRHARIGARSVISVPVITRGQTTGSFSAYLRRIPLFVAEEVAIAEILAQQSGAVLDHANAYARLAETNERLESATRAKTVFLANMSHELRTPLNATLGFSDLLLEQLEPTLTAAQRRYFANIRDAGRHLLDLINEVLDLSKVEAGRLELRPETVGLHDLVDSAVSSASTSAEAREVDLQVDVSADVSVRVDPGRIRQVLHNLLSNAVKFTDPGGQVVLRASAEGRDLLLQVADTGIGIPKDVHDRVFVTFERLHEDRANTPGTGLGLALTKRLVDAHGGTIAFESEPGRGTTFRVRLPSSVVEPMKGERLLIVEDDARDAELVAALAAEVGLRSEVARSAAEARAAVGRDAPTAVVLDLRLPDERGERFLEEIKARPETSRIPVIVVTVEDDEGSSRPRGAEDHLTKPIDVERLSSWLRLTVARDGARSGDRATAPE